MMMKPPPRCLLVLRPLAALLCWLSLSGLPPALANPVGGTVAQGSATFTTKGPQLTIQTSRFAAINWQSFNVAAGETTIFQQPSASSVVWNRINDSNPSQILGHIEANGLVVLQNSSGFYVGGQASIMAPGLIMTTSRTPPPDLAGSGAFEFDAPPPTATIINYGQLTAGTGGSIYLIASDIENHGTLTAPGGNLGLYAGKEVLVSERPDGRGLSARVTLPAGSVDNSGKLIADAGTISLDAQVVNQGGLIQADSVRDANGAIELVAADSVTLGSSSVISARGDTQGTSAAGSVTVKSANTFNDAAGSVIDVSGGTQGGNGGHVEISAPALNGLQSQIQGGAIPGWEGGVLSLDPQDITLSSGGSSAGSGSIIVGTPPNPGTLTLNVASLSGFSQIDLQASDTITVATGWNLGDSADPNATLTLQAGKTIAVNSGAFINAGQNWTVNLFSGVDFTQPNLPVISGKGAVTLTGTGYLETYNGNLNVQAGQTVTVATGAIRTVGGGNVSVTALSGNVTAGVNSFGSALTPLAGYIFTASAPYYTVSPNLSGISTAAGGNVAISAGTDVIAAEPTSGVSYTADAGSGAFGPEPGVVTVNAGRNVTGHFVAADSVQNGQPVASTITAGANAGTSSGELALSLVAGGWQVNAPNGGIVLQEVRNPNGMFNTTVRGTGDHLFDYDPQSFVDLSANSVELDGSLGQAAFRSTTDKINVPTTYPPSLDIQAGSGGIQLDNPVTLFPSPYGELNITTTGGGSLIGSGNGSKPDLIVSDLNPSTWVPADGGRLALGHGAVPIQLANPNPAVLDISGNFDNFYLVTPKETQITVNGNLDNTSFLGQNLHPSDVTFIKVGGRIFNANSETFYTLNQPLSAGVSAEVNNQNFLTTLLDANGNPVFSNGGNGISPPQFYYAPGTLVVATLETISSAQYQALVNTDAAGNPVSLKPLYNQLFINGVPQVTAAGLPIPDLSRPISFLDLPTLTALYLNSHDTPTYALQGYQVGGPGKFVVNANSVDLGSTPGIKSVGPANNIALAGFGGGGAAINLNVNQDLTMFSSTIASFFGGDIDINSGGTINVGSQEGLGLNNPAAGIYTVGLGSINITAAGTIDVAGSRIATFNGGNINLESLRGDVNAGNGGETSVNITLYQFNPATGSLLQLDQTFSGSGIQAYTLPSTLEGNDPVTGTPVVLHENPSDLPGNIAITTPRGNIISSQGGIIQEPLNGNVSAGPSVTLIAGTHNGSTVIYPGNIDVSGSGVIGGGIHLDASGSINGLVVGRQNTTVNAVENFSGTLLSGGTAALSAGGSVSGTVIGVSGVSVSGGGTVTAALESANVSVGGQQTAGLPTTASASSTAQSATQEASTDNKAQAQADTSQDDENKRKGKRPLLAKSTGRVTVILPN